MSSTNTTSEGPDYSTGQFHSVKGTVVEAIGGAVGSAEWQKAGKQEHAEGETEMTAAQAQQYVQGVADRVTGYKDSVIGAVTGDTAKQAAGNVQQELGKAQQKANEL